jgi:hypothetical protein
MENDLSLVHGGGGFGSVGFLLAYTKDIYDEHTVNLRLGEGIRHVETSVRVKNVMIGGFKRTNQIYDFTKLHCTRVYIQMGKHPLLTLIKLYTLASKG